MMTEVEEPIQKRTRPLYFLVFLLSICPAAWERASKMCRAHQIADGWRTRGTDTSEIQHHHHHHHHNPPTHPHLIITQGPGSLMGCDASNTVCMFYLLGTYGTFQNLPD